MQQKKECSLKNAGEKLVLPWANPAESMQKKIYPVCSHLSPCSSHWVWRAIWRCFVMLKYSSRRGCNWLFVGWGKSLIWAGFQQRRAFAWAEFLHTSLDAAQNAKNFPFSRITWFSSRAERLDFRYPFTSSLQILAFSFIILWKLIIK